MILKFLGCDERSRQLNDEWWKIFRAPMPITQAGDGEYRRLYFNFYGLPEYLGWHAYKKWHNKEAREAFADYENS
ncbi:MAG: hypothetical protein LBH29_04055, partial [Elusimicrobiota bacterium]|nr:hypothetical protein [Elusimicrobiota bacterium]